MAMGGAPEVPLLQHERQMPTLAWRESEIDMHHMLSSDDVLKELVAVEGRYIEWEWDPQTLKNDYITLREAGGHQVVAIDKSGREISFHVARDVIQRLIREHSVYEDESKRAACLRIYRPTAEGQSRGVLQKAS
jgi:hypothetical protein